MRHPLLVSFLALCLVASSAPAQTTGSATTDSKAGTPPNVASVDENGEARFKLGFGGRNWRGEDPRKLEKAEKEAKEAKEAQAKQVKNAAPPAAVAAKEPATPPEEKKKLRSDSKLKSDVIQKPAPTPTTAATPTAQPGMPPTATASPATGTPQQPGVPLPVVPGAK